MATTVNPTFYTTEALYLMELMYKIITTIMLNFFYFCHSRSKLPKTLKTISHSSLKVF